MSIYFTCCAFHFYFSHGLNNLLPKIYLQYNTFVVTKVDHKDEYDKITHEIIGCAMEIHYELKKLVPHQSGLVPNNPFSQRAVGASIIAHYPRLAE
jgi:hypothetical protein